MRRVICSIPESREEADYLRFKADADDGLVYDLPSDEFDDSSHMRDSAQRGYRKVNRPGS